MRLHHWTPVATALAAATLLAACSKAPEHEGVTRTPIPNSSFPISQAVKVPATATMIYLSGQVPAPADPNAAENTAQYWGDTYVQTVSVLKRVETALEAQGLSMSDVVKMQAFLVGDPALGGIMDFNGFMKGYTEFFGTEKQPNLPVRTTVQVAGLARPGMLVEIEVTAVQP